MSLQLGNKYAKNGNYKLALEEYLKIPQNDPMYKHARFNIEYIKRIDQNEEIDSDQKILINDEVLLSIIMPVYNVAQYLDACILSVRAQTYRNFELIIINDASSDHADEIIKMHASLDDRIKYIPLPYNTLGGAGIPSNIGMKLAKGKYIAFVDSDDWVNVDAFKTLVNAAEEKQADLVIGDFCTFDDKLRKVDTAYDKEFWNDIPKNVGVNLKEYPQLLKFSPVPWRKLYKTSFIRENQIHYPEGDFFFEDNPLHWETVTKAKQIVLVEKVISFHRMAREGQTMSSGAFKFSALFDHMNIIRIKMNKTEDNLVSLKSFIFKSRWIINRQKDPNVENLFKKRLSQEYYKCKTQSKNLNEIKFIAEYDKSYIDSSITVVIYAEKEDKELSKTLNSLLKNKLFLFDVLVLIKDIGDDRISILNNNSNNILYFNFNREYGRALNSLQPLCSGEYVLFVKAGDLIENREINKIIIEARKQKADIILTKDLNNILSNNILVNRGFMHYCSIFFGSTQYAYLSYFYLSFIYSKKVYITENKFVNTDFLNLKDLNLEELFSELDNLVQRINFSVVNKNNLEIMINSLAKLLTNFEKDMDKSSYEKFKILENKFLQSLNSLEDLK